MPAIDLHTHSTASDGTLTPSQLIELAHESGLKAIAVTDHDSISGIKEAIETGKKLGIEVIPGCELSVECYVGILHIVGLFIDPYKDSNYKLFEELRKRRDGRNTGVIKKLNDLGFEMSEEEVNNKAKGTIGRPHIAQVMLEKGYIKTLDEAFNKYLGRGKKAYVPKSNLSPEEAFELLSKLDATSIMAHPYLMTRNIPVLEGEIAKLKKLGLEGIELYYTTHTNDRIDQIKKFCRKYELIPSGGSDFHGDVKPEIKLGKGKGKLFVHHSVLDDIKALRQSKGQKISFNPD